MGDPVSLAVAGASAVSTGLSAAGSLTGAAGQSAGAKLQAQKAEQAAQYARLQADQTDVQMREELRTTLANIDAIRASAGADPGAPTAMAIKDNEARISDRERNARTLGLRAQALQSEADAAFYRSSAKGYLTAGRLAAAGALFKGVGGAYSSYNAGKG